MNLFSGATLHALEQGLNGAALKQRTISQNIANVDTPNYKAKKVVFQHALDEAMEGKAFQAYKRDNRHIDFSNSNSRGPYVTSQKGTMYNHNQNNVDIDMEMAELAKNQIYYNALIERLNGRFNSLQTAIKGGR